MTVTVLCLGQSQMAGWFVYGTAPNRGADAFQSQLAGLLGVSPATVVLLNGAVGGTAADRQAAVDPTSATLDIDAGTGMWWWDLEADSGAGAAGPVMTRAEGIVTASGLEPDIILWAQGHQDAAAHYYPPAGASPTPTPDRFDAATLAIFARLRSLYGANIPIVLQELDTPFDVGGTYVLYAPQIAVLRQRQLAIVLDTDDTYFGASTTQYGLNSYRAESFGYLHFKDETYRLVAQAMARAAAPILGGGSGAVTDPTVTARLRLPYLAEAMLNADVAINEGLDILDSRVGTAVLSDALTSPPASPAIGDLYLVPADPTGAWAGQTGRVARWDGGAWLLYPPQPGWRLYVAAIDVFRYWDGDEWLTEQIGTASASGVTNDSGVTGASVADALDALDAAKADSADLGTAAAEDVEAFATAAQGALADSAVQPGDLAAVATSGDYEDLTGKPVGIDDSAASTAITIDSSNRVGIGTASPGNSLHVRSLTGLRIEGTHVSNDTIDLVPGRASSVDILQMRAVNANRAAQVTFHPNGTNTHTGFSFYNASDDSNSGVLQIGVSQSTSTAAAHRAFLNTRSLGTPAYPITELWLGGLNQSGAVFDAVVIGGGALQMGTSPATVISAARHHQLRSYTVGTLPSAATAAELIYVSDDVGGAVPAFSDGTDWRRVTDRAAVST